ncbi:phosphate ABC transporter ATP-binding protein [Chrysiogenes arsenatis]|uniref:phosphate ABC transporter ATP-binding protein n=1 Tax=Chrysiogenes arsenatis TaxID=309797 RepID=UPI00041E4EFB|nr:phosphate ABC transporter ATP-binding protein [Chrysiogenes arsenatis]
MSATAPILSTHELSLHYGTMQALNRVSLDIVPKEIAAIIGPSGCGKSSLVRCFNRMHDLYANVAYQGEIRYDGNNVLAPSTDCTWLRRRLGMVFPKPVLFPKSLRENMRHGLKMRGIAHRAELDDRMEAVLRRTGLWNECKDRLDHKPHMLSLGLQQRLVIARALSMEPEILILDEPTSALDPVATGKIEELLLELKASLTIILVTNNIQQAARLSDTTAFMYLGRLVECNRTEVMFTMPKDTLTEAYITGRFS